MILFFRRRLQPAEMFTEDTLQQAGALIVIEADRQR